jgi:hypothetical protein
MKIKNEKILIDESEKSSHDWLLLRQLITDAGYILECIKHYKTTHQEKYIINGREKCLNKSESVTQLSNCSKS